MTGLNSDAVHEYFDFPNRYVNVLFCFQLFHAQRLQRQFYLYKGTPMAVLFKYQQRTKLYLDWNGVY